MKIAELADGRELKFPDSMDDRSVDNIVRLLTIAEATASAAQSEVKALRERVDAMMAQPKGKGAVTVVDLAPVVRELQAMQSKLEEGFTRMLEAQLADTVIVRDETGEPVRSKKVKR